MSAVLFDLDGTLLDTLQDIANACNAALARYNFPAHPMDAYRYFVGDGVSMLISRVVPTGQHDPKTLANVAAAYKEEYQRQWSATTRLYNGIPDMLDQLKLRGVPLGVLSNKPDDFTHRCVSEFLSKWSFGIVLGASPACPPKPNPAGALRAAAALSILPKDVFYLGDTSTDMKTANAAGMVPVGVLWGFRTAEELKESGAKHLIKHPRELLSLF
jgi:phosphoglycolate phosphatase